MGNANQYGTGFSNIYESLDGVGNFPRDWRYKDADAYIQDDYVVSQRLTLNLGLRYEHIGDLGSADGTGNVVFSALDPNPGAAGSYDGYLVTSNYNGGSLATPAGVIRGSNTIGYNGDGQNTWNPRVGFAWLLPGTDRFLLRGGIGMYHTTTEGLINLQLAASAPTGQWSELAGASNVGSTVAAPFPSQASQISSGFNPPSSYSWTPFLYSDSTEFTVDAMAQDFRPPTTYHYSLGLQSKLPGGAVFNVSYAGARDLHEIMTVEPNQAPLASPTNPITYDSRWPDHCHHKYRCERPGAQTLHRVRNQHCGAHRNR